MLNFRQLKSFVCIAEYKSFTRAARELFMTQPAISAQIKALEEFLDIRLLERLDKKVILTEAGQTFLKEAQKMISIYDEAISALEELKGLKKGKLFIGASTIPGEYIIPRYIGAFRNIYSQINLSLRIGDTGSIIDSLKERKINIGIVGAKLKDKDIVYSEFLKDKLIVIAHPETSLQGEKVIFEEIIKSPIILREPGSGTRMALISHLQKLNISENELNLAMELGSTRAVITAVESNLGISVVSKWAAAEALKLKKIIKLNIPELEINRLLYIATHRTRYYSHAAKTFLEFLQQPVNIIKTEEL